MLSSEPVQVNDVANANTLKYVLDTNVLLHDPAALFRFQEHDIYLPLVVLEELDRHKKGVEDLARNARQVTRSLDNLLQHGSMEQGFALAGASEGRATGKLYFRESTDLNDQDGPVGLQEGKADNQILACARNLLHAHGNAVLVTKDINLRVKALALKVPAQDYRSDRVLSDEDILPTGYMEIDASFWLEHGVTEKSYFRRNKVQAVRVPTQLPVNSFLVEQIERNDRKKTRLWRVESFSSEGSVLLAIPSQAPSDNPLISAQNEEQQMALNLLHDTNVDFVALLGKAGSGKTLLALAAGLEQVSAGLFDKVLITRATVPLGDDIGFLPGTEEEKMAPWLKGTLEDQYVALQLDEKNPLRQKVVVASMSFMRGRSFPRTFLILDEGQNLRPEQMRALLTRAGEGTKIVVTGNLAQIDTPYLDEGTSGLTWAAKNLHDWPHAGHIILPRGVRSRLATYVEDIAAKKT